MKTIIVKIKKIINRLLAFVPTPLPVGKAEFDIWVESILDMSTVPKNDSTAFALATMVLHLPPTANYKAKEYFLRHLHKSAANQVAAALMQELKAKQEENNRREAEARANAINVTPTKE
jgi:hypothetical protein